MGKFLKKIQSSGITGYYDRNQISIMNHYKDQPNNGPTIYAFENPETKATRTAFVAKKTHTYASDEYDDITDFTWRFGYNNGHPCIFITFHNFHQDLEYYGAYICLETNTLMSGKNKSINVGDASPNEINTKNKNITYRYFYDINFNQEFCLYITGREFGNIKGPWRIAKLYNKNREIPSDWKMNLNIRPSIRINGKPYTNYKALAEYINVEYFYNDEY